MQKIEDQKAIGATLKDKVIPLQARCDPQGG